MLNKLLFTDDEMIILSRNLIGGVAGGMAVGSFFNLAHLGFALGGVIATAISALSSYHKRLSRRKKVRVKATNKNNQY